MPILFAKRIFWGTDANWISYLDRVVEALWPCDRTTQLDYWLERNLRVFLFRLLANLYGYAKIKHDTCSDYLKL